MKLRLSILLLAAALAAAPAAGQTVKSLGYNTTNGNIVAATNVTFTNSVGFATNSRAATRTNLGGTTVGNAVFTATNAAAAATAIGLGTANEVTFGRVAAGNTSLSTNGFSGGDFAVTAGYALTFVSGGVASTTRTNLGLPGTWLTNTDVTNFRTAIGLGATNNVTFSNITATGSLAVSNAATFSTNVTVNGNISVGSLTTTTPSTWALDATQTAAATNGILALPSNANVIRLTNNNAISGVSGGVLGAFYYLVNQTTNAVTISNVGGITIDGAQNLTLSPNESATLVATGATNASVAARGDLNDVALGGTANTAPSQTASSGSSLMTRDLGDTRYGGPFYYAIAKTDTSVTNSTNTVSVASVTLPTGWYHFEVFWRSIFSAGGTIKQRFWNKSGTTSFGTVVHYQHQNISNTITYSGITRGAGFETNQGVYNLYGFVNITSEAELVIEFAQNSASTNTATIYGGAGMIFRKVE